MSALLKFELLLSRYPQSPCANVRTRLLCHRVIAAADTSYQQIDDQRSECGKPARIHP